MIRTVSINLSGQVFQIDENAFEKLKHYLESIRRRFEGTEGNEEIISDIESRIAEMFSEKLNPKKQVIILIDVEDVINIMGKPEDFDSFQEEDEPVSPPYHKKQQKRLYRNPDDKVIGGVCSGLSAYLGINDPIWFRLIFLLVFFFGVGGSLLVYIILWLILPEARTASQKLEMKGEQINISSIEKTIKQDLSDLKNKFSNLHTDDHRRKAHNFFERVIDAFITLFVVIFKLALKVVAFILILMGIVIAVASVIAVLLPIGVVGFLLPPLYPLVFTSSLMAFLAGLSIFLLVAIPAFWLVYLGFRILLNRRMRVKGLGLSFAGLWALGWLLAFFVGTRTAVDFKDNATVSNNIRIDQPAGDTLYLTVNRSGDIRGDDVYDYFGWGEFLIMEDKMLVKDRIKLDVKRSLTDEYSLSSLASARGKTNAKAYERASAINYLVNQDDSVLYFNDFFTIRGLDQFRGQEISLVLKVPEGKSVFLDETSRAILYDIKNVTNTYDGDMVGHTWIMMKEGLTCADCGGYLHQREDIYERGKVQRSMEFENFNELVIEGNFNIDIVKGDFGVRVSGDQDFADNIEFAQKSGLLSIDTKRNILDLFNKKEGTVYISLPSLSTLEISGANSSHIRGFTEKDITIKILGASESTIDLDADYLNLEVLGASQVTLSGAGDKMDAEITGASNLEAFDFRLASCNIEVSGASNAYIFVKDELAVEASGASNVSYKGLPNISSDVSGFSSIKPKR